MTPIWRDSQSVSVWGRSYSETLELKTKCFHSSKFETNSQLIISVSRLISLTQKNAAQNWRATGQLPEISDSLYNSFQTDNIADDRPHLFHRIQSAFRIEWSQTTSYRLSTAAIWLPATLSDCTKRVTLADLLLLHLQTSNIVLVQTQY